MIKHQLVEFKKFDGRIHYWAIKAVTYENGNPVKAEVPRWMDKQIHTEAVNNPRIYADEHDWSDE
jgi:hypothetical protein